VTARKEYRIRLLTPAFAGGADQKKAELRASSIRGGLRFWTRAILGYYVGSSNDGLKEISKIEKELFGDTKNASLLQIRVSKQFFPPFEKLDVKGSTKSLSWLGYDCLDLNGKLKRNAIPHETVFTVFSMFRRRNKTDASDEIGIRSVENLKNLTEASLWCFITFGGLGSRSRNGWGSMKFESDPEISFLKNDIWKSPTDGLQSILSSGHEAFGVKGNATRSLPGYSHFSKGNTGIFYGNASKNALAALSAIGRDIIDWRDQNLTRKEVRAAFGLPYSFGKGTIVHNKTEKEGRRAGPLLLSICADAGEFFPVMLFLKSVFLPKGAYPVWKKNIKTHVDIGDPNSTISSMLNGLAKSDVLTDKTPEVLK